jgi:hypothetical protein
LNAIGRFRKPPVGSSSLPVGSGQGGSVMKRYLLSIEQPDGPPPKPVDLEQIRNDINALATTLPMEMREFQREV